ncbi:methyltransferase family protein [Halobaculum sp. P14]|uniref:methyltransferase family protein n=1 Tax=Halobaculum sp. P14 TaxID=3421638 RepID=UPI003EBFC13A
MTPPFLQSPYSYVFWATYAAWVVPEFVDALRRDGGGADHDANSKYVLYATFGVAAGVAFVLGFVAPEWATFDAAAVPLFWVGIALQVGGAALRWYTVALLGDAFSRTVTVSASQGVVDSGPYAVVRHPTYTAGVLLYVGLSLALGTWPGVAVTVPAVLAGYGHRIRVEERALRRHLDGYDDYCDRTPYRLIPGVY